MKHQKVHVALLTTIMLLIISQFALAQPANNPHLDAFSKKTAEDQLTQLSHADFSNAADKELAQWYFEKESANVQKNPALFTKYLRSEGVTLNYEGKEKEGIIKYENGILTAKNGKTDVVKLAKDYSFEVTPEGDLVLIDKNTAKHTFSGELNAGENGLQLKDGNIDGISVHDSKDIKFFTDKEKTGFTGIANQVDNVGFEKPAQFSYNTATHEVTFTGSEPTKLTTTATNTPITVSGDFVLPNGVAVTGRIRLEKNTLSIPSENANTYPTQVDGYAITPRSKSAPVQLFFDGEPHAIEEPYFSFSKDRGKITASSGNTPLSPGFLFSVHDPNNGIFSMQAAQMGPITITPDAGLLVSNGARLEIQNRERNDLIPEVTAHLPFAASEVRIVSGIQKVSLNGKGALTTEFVQEPNGRRPTTSVPMTLHAVDANDKSLLGTKEYPLSAILGRHSEIGMLGKGAIKTKADGPLSQYIISETLMMYPEGTTSLKANTEIIRRNVNLAGGGALAVSEPDTFLSPNEKATLVAKIRAVPQEIWTGKQVKVYDDAEFPHGSAWGFYDIKTDTINLRRSVLSAGKEDVLYHENLHAYGEKDLSWMRAWGTATTRYLDEQEGNKINSLTAKTKWNDGTDEPRYGFVHAYAATNYREDFANTGAFMALHGKQYQSLVNPKSTFYEQRITAGNNYADGRMTAQHAQEWANNYLAKAIIARQYKIIDATTYADITAGISQDRINKVREEIRTRSQQNRERR